MSKRTRPRTTREAKHRRHRHARRVMWHRIVLHRRELALIGDKTTWGPGPWHEEPDRLDWRHAGFPCLIIRNHHGVFCGYIAVEPGHPWHRVRWPDADVHGGITFSAWSDPIHSVRGNIDRRLWWIGFDCGHMGHDRMPGMERFERELARKDPRFAELCSRAGRSFEGLFGKATYRTIEFVRAEVESLADQAQAAVVAQAVADAQRTPEAAL